MPGEDGMLHLALGFGEGGIVEVMVVGVERILELDECMSGEKDVKRISFVTSKFDF